MPEQNEQQPITYQVGGITFIVTPVYKPQQEKGESLAAILLRLMKADVERV